MSKTKLKLDKTSKWKMATPCIHNFSCPLLNNPQPLYYIQEGNMVFIKLPKLQYVIEINQELPL